MLELGSFALILRVCLIYGYIYL